jgi:tetratricopeptide (TPR) repeat protein
LLRLFSSILEWLQNLLGIFVDKPSSPAAGQTDHPQTPSTIEVVAKIPKKTSPPLNQETPRWNLFYKTFAVDRWQWLRYNFWVVIIILILIAVAFFSENGSGPPWWADFWQRIKLWLTQIWETRPVTVTLVGILLFLFLFGIDWLRQLDNWLLRFWQWATSHRQITTTLGVLLIILIFYILANANTWAFTSVEVWSEEKSGLSGNEIAVHFRGNLNAIGTTSFEALTVSVPSSPAIVTSAKSNLKPLSLNDCQQILVGPKSFVASGGRAPVSLPRLSRAEADNGTAGQISLGTTLGNFNLPLQGLFRLIFSYTSPNYRELSAQIVPASRTSNPNAIRIIVTAIDGNRWTVEGLQEQLPQLVNFLTYRIALDWKAQRTEQAADRVESADLALALGNQAFAARDFSAALAYYQLAEWFRADSAIIEVMLGLTQLQLSRSATGAEFEILLDRASRAFNQAAALDPNNTDLYPYLACLYQLANNNETAEQQIEAFNKTLGPDNPDAKQERITELDKKPPLGPGRRLSTFLNAETFDLYYISDDAAQFALSLPYQNPEFGFQPITSGEAPRQIFAVADGAYYITADGLVNFFRPGSSTNPAEIIPVIDTTNLQLAVSPDGELTLGTFPLETEPDLNVSQLGGVRQIFAENDLLFLLDRFGRIVRLRVSPSGTGGLIPVPQAVNSADARQIFLDTNALYLLKEDGTIWRISEPRTGNLQTARQLVADTDNREITAANGVVYILRTNGNIWRYRDGEGAEGDLLKRIDGGVETSRINIDAGQGLFVLKNSGATWLIRNPQDPGPNDIGKLNLPPANRAAIDIAGPNLISLERTETTAPEVKLYQDFSAASNTIANQVAQAPADDMLLPTSTAIPTPTPAPSPTTPPSPTATAIPQPTETPTLELETPLKSTVTLPAEKPLTQTRAIDDAVEILIKSSDEEANWFWIDQTEVTNEQYRSCVDAEVCSPNQPDYAVWFYQAGHPVVGVTWLQAQTYCQWAGGNLPTVSQWRFAASPDGRMYPWGNTGPSCLVAVINDTCDNNPLGTRVVGSKPDGASPAGVMDLIGNVWEWTATQGNKNDARVTLGGSWSNPDGTDEGGFNAFNPATTISQGETRQVENLGFRCARSYQPAAQ